MSKEDMMNKISFALKDPILQMGFEVICSKLSRLEKEKCELLGLIQAKDKLIKKMKSCATCKYWNSKDIQKYCNKRTATSEFAERSLKCDKWELAE